jgi:hypothetical protein
MLVRSMTHLNPIFNYTTLHHIPGVQSALLLGRAGCSRRFLDLVHLCGPGGGNG